MRFYEEKWSKNVIDLYPQVDKYVNTIGPLLGHIKQRHPQDTDLCRIIHKINDFVFHFYLNSLKPLRPGKEASLEDKTKHNCSITTIKEEHRRFRTYINSKFGSGKPQRNKIIWPGIPGTLTAPLQGSKHEWHRISKWRKEQQLQGGQK